MRSTFLILTTSAILLSADFWQQKPPDQWSPQDCKKLLSKSPWAMDAPVTGNAPSTEGTGSVGFNPSGSSGSGGTSMRTVTVRWESAEPIQAAAKRLSNSTLPESDLAQFYVIHVSNLQVPGANESAIASEMARTKDRLKSQSKLTRKSKAPIACARVTGTLIGGPGLMFFFPKEQDSEIKAGDNDVQFEAELTTLDVKAKFPLKNMTFGGRLAL